MKKILFIVSAFAILFISQSLMIMKKDGAAPGYTGSPGDSLKNCTACHGGFATNVNNWITSDIPPGGYVPGTTYTITATNRESGATRFGFEVSPQDVSGNLLGTMIITDNIRTKFVGGNKYITYTENGVEGVDSLSWSFQWVAPLQEKEVVFYGGFNSNFDGHKGGDQTFLSTLKVKRDASFGIAKAGFDQKVKVYPNPTFNYIQIDFEVKSAGRLIVEVIDMNGRQVSLLMNGDVSSGTFSQKFDIASLADGSYYIRVSMNGNITSH